MNINSNVKAVDLHNESTQLMEIYRDPIALQKYLQNLKRETKSIGFVPTMGALHEGHLSLIDRARSECDFVVASIFVNPTQFNSAKDLENYPSQLLDDQEKLQERGCHALFLPEQSSVYPDNFNYRVTEKNESKLLCGEHREGHFEGVLSIVFKLLNICCADRAYFGEKDFQQLRLIEGMTKAFFLPCEIVACPTIRETDGLAMSSRNLRLNSDERKNAAHLYRVLRHSKNLNDAKTELERLGFELDYLEEHWGRRFVAAQLGSVRLIDNVEIAPNLEVKESNNSQNHPGVNQ